MAFSIGGAILLFGIYRHRILDFLPIARNAVIEQMREDIIVCDGYHTVTDVNPAVESILERSKKEIVGRNLSDVFKDCGELVALWEHEGDGKKRASTGGDTTVQKPPPSPMVTPFSAK